MSRYNTYTYDNVRFFSPRTQGGLESGNMGWSVITAKGKREFLQYIDPERSCLVVVDMQQGCVEHWGINTGYSRISDEAAKNAEIFTKRGREIVIPNIQRLLKLFRENDMPVLFLVLENGKPISELERRSDEVVLSKYSSGAFSTCAIDNYLKEKGIITLFATGTDTCGCVDGTIHGAYDHGYQPILIEDACMSCRPELHDATVLIWRYKGFVKSTNDVISDYPWQNWIDPSIILQR